MSFNLPASQGPRTVPLTVVAVALLIAGAAAVGGTAAYFELRPSSPGTHVPPGANRTEVNLTDDTGRAVTVPLNPHRVVALAPSIMDSLFRLGLRSHVVGIDCYAQSLGGISSDYTPAQIAEWNLSSSMCIQTGPTLSVEQVLNATPDVVLASTIVSVSDVEELSSTFHLPVVILQPSTVGGILVDVELLDEIFPGTPAVPPLLSALQGGLAQAVRIQANVSANQSPLPSVLMTYWADSAGYWSYGPGTFGDSLISLVSAVNIAANQSLPYPELSGAQVLATDPSYILYATGFGVDLSLYAQGPDWSSFSAVSAGHDFAVDSTLLTEPGPTMILTGLPLLLAALHPAGH